MDSELFPLEFYLSKEEDLLKKVKRVFLWHWHEIIWMGAITVSQIPHVPDQPFNIMNSWNIIFLFPQCKLEYTDYLIHYFI